MSRAGTEILLTQLGRNRDYSPVRVGVLLDGREIPRWAGETLAVLRDALWIEWAGVFVLSEPVKPAPDPGLAERLFRAYERLGRGRDKLRVLVPLATVPGGSPAHHLPEENWRAAIQKARLDVLIFLGHDLPGGDCTGLANYGVWSLLWGDPREGAFRPAFFWEVANDSPITTASLVTHSSTFSAAHLIYRATAATRPGLFPGPNAAAPVTAAKRMILRRLFDLADQGWDWLRSLPEWNEGEYDVRPEKRYPALVPMARFLSRRLAITCLMNWRNSRTQGNWFSAYRDRADLFTARQDRFQRAGFRELPEHAEGYGYADPLPVRWDGRDLIFAEEILPNSRGRLVVFESDNGTWRTPPTVILDRPHHLSYPLVFEHDGDHFLIPESAAAGCVELLRATRFPYEWTLETVLAEGVPLADTTPLRLGDNWYFFTTALCPHTGAGLEQLIFYSKRLVGPWHAHPCNPISTDERNARMAGRFFHRRGRLIRPAQDCTRCYGRAIRLNEVLHLTETEYEERFVEEIDASWHPSSERTHTLNATETLETIDGWVRRPIRNHSPSD